VIDTWESEDGLPAPSVTAMGQDSEGYLWLGTTKGLVRWDGMQFVVLDATNTTALPSDGTITLVPDRSGALGVGTVRLPAPTTSRRPPAADSRSLQLTGRGAATTLSVLAALRHHPMLSLKQPCATTAMSFPTASKAMLRLVELGIARELTGQRRDRIFVYDAYLARLNEGGHPL